ncbi:MAG: class I SAM-dependent methyltransferase [Aggregatilineales bacterium]
MDEAACRALNALNRAFYAHAAEHFDESRGRAWNGWRRLLPYLESLPVPRRILDVGCGNGRFGRFLARHLAQVCYHGTDNNAALLESARAAFTKMGVLPEARLELHDLLEDGLPEGEYELAALFGVLHHVPSLARRAALIRDLAARVTYGGFLVFTSWCFYDHARFRERLIALPPEYDPEHGDWLMDWRRGHAANSLLRYCHYVDEAEQRTLEAASGLSLVASFYADGHTDNINRYSLLQRR